MFIKYVKTILTEVSKEDILSDESHEQSRMLSFTPVRVRIGCNGLVALFLPSSLGSYTLLAGNQHDNLCRARKCANRDR